MLTLMLLCFKDVSTMCYSRLSTLPEDCRSHSLNVKLGALGAAWSVETGIHGQLRLEYSVGQLELEY
jgi:hypothetical protein